MRTYPPVCPHAGEPHTGGSATIGLGNSVLLALQGTLGCGGSARNTW